MGKYIKMDENFVHGDWGGFDIGSAALREWEKRHEGN